MHSPSRDQGTTQITKDDVLNGIITPDGSPHELLSGCVVIPETIIRDNRKFRVTGIGPAAFAGRRRITSVTIPDSVTSIGDGAFRGCEALTTVDNKAPFLSIGREAFSHCTSLQSVTIPDGQIGPWAFSDCWSLSTLALSNRLERIPTGAFYNCCSLRFLSLPQSISQVDDLAFANCHALNRVTALARRGKPPISFSPIAFHNARQEPPIIPGYQASDPDVLVSFTISAERAQSTLQPIKLLLAPRHSPVSYNPLSYLVTDDDITLFSRDLLGLLGPQTVTISCHLLTALIALLRDWFPPSDYTLPNVLLLLSMAEAKEDDENFKSPLELMFEKAAQGGPLTSTSSGADKDSLAIISYRHVRRATPAEHLAARTNVLKILTEIITPLSAPLFAHDGSDSLAMDKLAKSGQPLVLVTPSESITRGFTSMLIMQFSRLMERDAIANRPLSHQMR